MSTSEGVRVAGRYELHELLGRGGVGQVWRGTDTVLDRPVAVKVVTAPLDLGGGDGLQRERLLREARAAARLQHPGAVSIYDVVTHEDRPHLIMELVEAPDLARVIAADGPLDPRDVARIGLDLLDVLDAAHAIGVVHRDVKPSNVLVAPSGTVRLTDFGTAVVVGEDRLTATDAVIGSPAYMAPEQATERDVGPAADLWSLGATLYHAVEGQPPYEGPSAVATMHAVVHEPPRSTERAGALAPALDGLLVHDPAARADSRTARALLEAAAGPRQATGTAAPVPAPSTEPTSAGAHPARPDGFAPALRRGSRRRRLVPALAALTLVVVAAVIAGVALTDRDDPVPDAVADGATATAVAPDPDVPGSDQPDVERPVTDDPAPAPAAVPAPPAGGPGTPPDTAADGTGPTDPPATAPEASGGGGAGGGGEGVPADWVTYAPDHAPYAVAHPPGWRAERLDETRTDLEDPGSPAYLRLDWTEDPAPDPLADWEAYEADFAASHPGYERIRLEPTTFDGQPAALWEYRYATDGGGVRAYNLNVSGERYGYALNFQTSETAWSDQEPLFDAFRASYEIVR
ncbi:protein kinase [Euzebya sp.]|uniref:serine/threonine-protein kinase n=1 Tax=Euzebya sp. TaxID=1971409 RepID=UPI0035129C91